MVATLEVPREKNTSPKKEHLITCPYGCGSQFPSDQDSLKKHLAVCPNVPKTGTTFAPPSSKTR